MAHLAVLTTPLFARSPPSSALTVSSSQPISTYSTTSSTAHPLSAQAITSAYSITTRWSSYLFMEMQPLHQLHGGNYSRWHSL